MFENLILRDAILIGVVWIVYFFIHSLFASLSIKHWVSKNHSGFMPAYRVSFNIIALVLIIIPAYILYTGHSVMVWQFNDVIFWLMQCLALGAVVTFFISLKYYDSQEFLGLRQLREHETRVEDQENLHISPLHRFVRHPWYTIALILIWTRPMNSLMLVSAILMTIYFFAGSRLEEAKLLSYYGDAYKKYRLKVPGLIPLPWKYMNQVEADELINTYKKVNTIK